MMRSAIQEELDKNGITVCTTRGDSMEPRDGGENYVLHRILKVREQDYVICGDNRWRPEYGIMDRHLVGVMTGIVRKGKEVPLDGWKYRLYVRLWCGLFPLRAFILFLRDIFGRIMRRTKR